jgi:phytoene desaturase
LDDWRRRAVADAIVIGGGVGGLAVAIRLRAQGHQVIVLERNEVVGGKLAVRERDGYRFDTGPSLVTLPHVFDDCFATVGARLADEVELRRLDPQCRYHWPDGSSLDVHDVADDTAAAMDAFSPGAGAAWRSFDEHGRVIWDVSERTFFAGPMSGGLDLVRRMRSPRDLIDIDPMTTLAKRGAKYFSDPRLQQWVGRYATYSGSSPYGAPATLACIPHIEARYGAWYPTGGLSALRDAFVRVAERCGVEIRTSTEVVSLQCAGERISGVTLTNGTTLQADLVVANVDAEYLYRDLVPDSGALRKVRRAQRSTSGLVVLVGARGQTPDLAHHNIWFSSDYTREFAQLGANKPAAEPTIYACVSSVSDPTQAPAGNENWFLLVNTPAAPERVGADYGEVVLDTLAARGHDLRARAEFIEVITPGDIESRYRSPGGAIYGSSSDGKRAAFVRPANRGPRRGLYLVGGSSHPGGGLPLVTISARIVADMIRKDGL